MNRLLPALFALLVAALPACTIYFGDGDDHDQHHPYAPDGGPALPDAIPSLDAVVSTDAGWDPIDAGEWFDDAGPYAPDGGPVFPTDDGGLPSCDPPPSAPDGGY